MKALVLAGAPSQVVLLNLLKERGIYTILADNNPNAVARPYADKFVKVDLMDVEAVKQVAICEKVDFLITVCADQVLITVAKVSQMLGLPCYIDPETAQLVSDKSHMKRVFHANGIPTSKNVFMDKLDFEKIKDMSYPFVVKPADGYSSKGVRKATNPEELETFFNEAVQISRNGVVIVEEFVTGAEITVDFQIVDGKAHLISASNTEKVDYKDRFLAFRTRFPAAISEETLERIRLIGQKIATAFGLKDCPMLVQLLTDDQKESVLEFCARTGGGSKYQLIKRASGFDPIEAVVDITLQGTPYGKKVTVGEIKSVSKLVTNEFVYGYPGIFDHLEGFEELKQQGVISDYWLFKWKGAEISKACTSSDRIVGITLESNSYEELVNQHNIINTTVKVVDSEGKDIMRHDMLSDITPL